MTDKDLAKFDSLCTKLLPKNRKEKSGQIRITFTSSLAMHCRHFKKTKYKLNQGNKSTVP